MKDTVLEFIKNFQTPETIKVFTEGCCYWFAFILQERFKKTAKLMYNPVDNHFTVLIEGNLYDITGQVESSEGYEEWSEFKKLDYLETERIYKYCILKTE